jgi:hypothetical protein
MTPFYSSSFPWWIIGAAIGVLVVLIAIVRWTKEHVRFQ